MASVNPIAIRNQEHLARLTDGQAVYLNIPVVDSSGILLTVVNIPVDEGIASKVFDTGQPNGLEVFAILKQGEIYLELGERDG